MSIKIMEKEIVAILSHADTQDKLDVLRECVYEIKKQGYDILISSHIQVPDEYYELVDYIVYDKENPIIKSGDFIQNPVPVLWANTGSYSYSFPAENSHSYAVFTLIKNATCLAHSNGYNKAHFVNYDYVIGEKEVLIRHSNRLDEYDIYSYFFEDLNTRVITTALFSVRVENFLRESNSIGSIEDFLSHGQSVLESFFYSYYIEKKNLTISQDLITILDISGLNIVDSKKIGLFGDTPDLQLLFLKEERTGRYFLMLKLFSDDQVDVQIKSQSQEFLIKPQVRSTPNIIDITDLILSGEITVNVDSFNYSKSLNCDSHKGSCEIKNESEVKSLNDLIDYSNPLINFWIEEESFKFNYSFNADLQIRKITILNCSTGEVISQNILPIGDQNIPAGIIFWIMVSPLSMKSTDFLLEIETTDGECLKKVYTRPSKTYQTFVFVHDQQIILDFEKINKFKDFKNFKYVFLGSGEVEQIKNLENTIIAREYIDNLEKYPNLTAYSGWYLLWKNDLCNADYINLFEYDVTLDSDFQKSLEESIKLNPLTEIFDYIEVDVESSSFIKYGPTSDLAMHSIRKNYNIDPRHIFSFMPIDLKLGATSNHTLKREAFLKYMEWLYPIIDEIKEDRLSGHNIERTLPIYSIIYGIPSLHLPGLLEHCQMDSHQTQGRHHNFDSNYFDLIRKSNNTDSYIDKINKISKIKGIIQVGASKGQEYSEFRKYTDNIICFEPIPKVYEELEINAPDAICFNFALGDTNEIKKMNISSNNGESSSFLTPKDHLTQYPSIRFDSEIDVEIKRFDSLGFNLTNHNVLVSDTQGYEISVLRGFGKNLCKLDCIYVEYTNSELYEGNSSLVEIEKYLNSYGFVLNQKYEEAFNWGNALFVNQIAMEYEHYYTLQQSVLSKYINHIFIETGTYLGDSVQLAIDCGFKKIVSIELNEKLYDFCKTVFKEEIGEGTVDLIFGDSLIEIKKIISNLTERATFWLDAHWDFGPVGEKLCPLYEEIEAIGESKIKNHTIMIDDMRCIGDESNWGNGLSEDILIKKIKEINPLYQISYEPSPCGSQDIMVAYLP